MERHSSKQPPIAYRPYDFPVLFPVLSFFGQNWVVSMRHPEFLHFHNCFEIGHCLNGSGKICFRDYELAYEAGQFTLINPLEPHISICGDQPSHWEYIFFDPNTFFDDSSATTALYQSFYLSQRPSVLIDRESNPFLHQTLITLYDEFHKKQPLYTYALHSLLFILLAEVNRLPDASCHSSDDCGITPVRTALLYIYSHYMESLTVAELAGHCCLSESHFRRIFKRLIGISPLEYLHHYRIQHACHLILQNFESMNRIAERVGYQTLSSFNRQFLQYTGLSPSAWKKKYLNSPIRQNVTSLEDTDTSGIFRF